MARFMISLMILVSVFATGTFAKRVATKQDTVRFQRGAAANGPRILPVQAALLLRPAVMARASVPVGMPMQEGGNPGKYPAELRKDWKGVDTSTVWMVADDDQFGFTVPDWTPEEIASFGGTPEKEAKYKVNVREAYDSLNSNIPQILQVEKKGKKPMDWDIYTDDLETEFPNIPQASPELGLFSAVVARHIPSWTASIKGKDIHKAALHEMQVFINNFAEKAEVTGQDWCRDSNMDDWTATMMEGCVLMEEDSGLDPELSTHEGDKVITSDWKMEILFNTGVLKLFPGYEDIPRSDQGISMLVWEERIKVTIQGLSRFHLNDEGKIYRHSIGECDIRLNQDSKREEVKVFLEGLASAPRAMK